MKIEIGYLSKTGNTKKIAEAIEKELKIDEKDTQNAKEFARKIIEM